MKGLASFRHSATAVAVCILLLGAVLTGLAVDKAIANVHALAQARFHQHTRDLRDNVIARLTKPRYGLGGLRSTVASHDAVPSVAEFRAAVLARDLPQEFPGVLGFGLIVPVLRSDLPTFSASVSSEYNGDFSVVTSGNNLDLYVVRSMEPLGPNRAVLGFDAGSEIVRRTAIESALRSGALAITAPLHLLQVTDGAWGAVYLLPAYTSDVSGKRTSIGLVVAAINYRTSLIDLDRNDASLRFSLDDHVASSLTTIFAGEGTPFAAVASQAHFRDAAVIDFGGRHFSLTMISTPAFDASESDLWPWLLGCFGASITALVAFAVWLLIKGQRRAVALAKQMTHDLARLSMVAKLMQDAVLVTDERGRVKWANPAFYRASRRPPKEVLAHQATPFLGQLVDEKSGQQEAWTAALAGKGAFHGLASRAFPDGTTLWLETEIQTMRDEGDRPDGLIIIQSDVTGRRNAELLLRESQSFLDRTGRVAGVGGWQLDLATQAILWSAHTRRIHEAPDHFTPTLASALAFFPDEAREALENVVQRSIATGKGWDLELPLVTYGARDIWVRIMGVVEFAGEKAVRITGALQDITSRKRLELDLQENRELLRVTLSCIGDAVVTTDPAGVVTWMNPVAERLSGWLNDEAKGQSIVEVLTLVSEDTRLTVPNPIMAALAEKKTVALALNTLLLTREGTECAVDDSAAPIFDTLGNLLGGVMVFHDVTEMRAVHREIAHHARHDPLTGLPNRLAFDVDGAIGLTRAKASGVDCVVLFIDLDHFKNVNDTGGHAAGDALLRQVGAIITSSLRSGDTVARIGGDEFAIFLENCSAPDGVLIAQKIRDAVDLFRFTAVHDQPMKVGASIGIACSDVAGYSLEALLLEADKACYASKTAGRNRIHLWRPEDSNDLTKD